MSRKTLLTFLTVLSLLAIASALSVNPTGNADALAKAVLGEGIKLLKATYTGSPDSSGTYSNGPQNIRDAAVLTSGDAADTIPTGEGDKEIDSKAKGTDGSIKLCEDLAGEGGASYDAAILSMDVELSASFDGFSAEFVFATEEYPEYIGSMYNDVFGIYVDDKQVAFDGDNAPITVNGPFFSSDNVLTPPNSGSSYQGSTPLLKSGAKAAPGKHHIDIAICDISDRKWDSSVFVAINACKGSDCKSGTQIITKSPSKPNGHYGTATGYYGTGTGTGGMPTKSCITLTSTATYTTSTCDAYSSCHPTTYVKPATYTLTPEVSTPPCKTYTYTTDGHISYSTYTPEPVTTYPLPTGTGYYDVPSNPSYTVSTITSTSCPAYDSCTTATYYSTYTPTEYADYTPTSTAVVTYSCPGAPECAPQYTGISYNCPGSQYCTSQKNVTGPTALPEQWTGGAARAGTGVMGVLGALVAAGAMIL